MMTELEILALIDTLGFPAVVIYLIFRLEKAFGKLTDTINDLKIVAVDNSKMIERIYQTSEDWRHVEKKRLESLRK